MERSSHALADEGSVWLIDPVSDDAALEAALGLGDLAGVIQLLDRHNRDCEALAEEHGVPHLRLPETVAGSPFELGRTLWAPGWRELHLWWPERRLLVVSEALGTGDYFAVGRRAGIHPMLRLKPPGSPRKYDPEHLLTGHGPSVHGDGAGTIEEAYAHTRGDIPRMLKSMVRSG